MTDCIILPFPLMRSVSKPTHTRLTALKPIWILLKQETVSGSSISWAICKSAPRSRQITTPAPYHSSFLQARCPFCRPTNSVKALKALSKQAKHIAIHHNLVHIPRHDKLVGLWREGHRHVEVIEAEASVT